MGRPSLFNSTCYGCRGWTSTRITDTHDNPNPTLSVAFTSAAVTAWPGDFVGEKFFAKRATIAFIALGNVDRL